MRVQHPANCPEHWDPTEHPDHTSLVGDRVRQILTELASGALNSATNSADTRGIHQRLYTGLTPRGCPYFAGHYRGEDFRCLRGYEVCIPSDSRVGYPASFVCGMMASLKSQIRDTVNNLDSIFADNQVSEEDKLLKLVEFACQVFVDFLTIHPYANGNGHSARFVMRALFSRYQIWLNEFPIEPRPADPPYSSLIRDYRSGDREPLQLWMLERALSPAQLNQASQQGISSSAGKSL